MTTGRGIMKTPGSKENQRLTAWLKSKRLERGLTMRGLAQRLDVHYSYIGKVEYQKRRLDVIEYVRYCQALRVDPIDGIMAAENKLEDTKEES